MPLLGFEPFGPFPRNPTAPLVRDLAEGRPGWHGEVLPVDPDLALDRLHELLMRRPRVVVGVGIREGLDRLQFNPAALNWVSLRDLALRSWFGPLDTSLPVEVRMTAADERDASRRLKAADVRFDASDDAGMQVCNAVLFHGIVHAPRGTRFYFLHVPPRFDADRELAVEIRRGIEALAAP